MHQAVQSQPVRIHVRMCALHNDIHLSIHMLVRACVRACVHACVRVHVIAHALCVCANVCVAQTRAGVHTYTDVHTHSCSCVRARARALQRVQALELAPQCIIFIAQRLVPSAVPCSMSACKWASGAECVRSCGRCACVCVCVCVLVCVCLCECMCVSLLACV